MSSLKGGTVLPQSRGEDVIEMLPGFVEEVCPRRKTNKAMWTDNDQAG